MSPLLLILLGGLGPASLALVAIPLLGADIDLWRGSLTAGGIAGLYGLHKLIQTLRDLRKVVVQEVKAELALDSLAADKGKIPSPLIVKPDEKFVTEKKLEEVIAALSDQNRAETEALGRQIEEIKRLDRERTGTIHQKIDVIAKQTDRTDGLVEGLSETLREIRADIRQLNNKGEK